MKIPRDISGEELSKLLRRYNYKVVRYTGSHIRLTTTLKGDHHITIPKHSALKLGTLNSILNDVSEHLKTSKETLLKELFG